MPPGRMQCAFLAASVCAGGATAQTPIFLDDFETGAACTWRVAGPDLCGPFTHSGANLYRLDPHTLDVILVGPFNTGGPVINDIAIDRNDTMIGVSLAKIWSIDRTSGAATEVAPFDGATDGLTSLAFVPLDDSDPESAERLITAGNSGNVYEIDPATGAATLLGNFGLSGGSPIRSAGDLVSVRGLGTFASVSIGNTASDPDFLATIDTTTWAATTISASSTGFDKVFGLAFWGGSVLGFVDDGAGLGTGRIIDIDLLTGVGALLQPTAVRWFGAAVATDAPVAP